MLSSSRCFVPLVGTLRRVLQQIDVSVKRNFWGPPDILTIIRDVDHQMGRLEQDFFDYSPFRCLMPLSIPIQGIGGAMDAYRLKINVQGYKSEEITVSVGDNVLLIKVKMEQSAEDGSKFYQEVKREFTLPDNIEHGS